MSGTQLQPSFQQPGIAIQRVAEFEQLRGVIERVFSSEAKKFLKVLKKQGLKVRDVDAVLARNLMDRVDQELARSGKSSREIYQSLPVSDQAQIREFYLVRLEQVGDEVRRKFNQVYRLN